jgi:CheY-like chemotaxis protein
MAVPRQQVLLVEDEALIRMMIIEMLEELGHRVSGEAGRIAPAVSLAQTAEFDLALLRNENGPLGVNRQARESRRWVETATALTHYSREISSAIANQPDIVALTKRPWPGPKRSQRPWEGTALRPLRRSGIRQTFV